MAETITHSTAVDGDRAAETGGEESELVVPALPCPACGSPYDVDDRFCIACGQNLIAETPPLEEPAAAPQRHFRCDNCGSEVATDLDQRSYTCAFCDSTYVVEIPPAESGRQRPEFVIGFAVTPDEAQQKFRQWLASNHWFRPGDLKTAHVAEKMRGVYLPFWSFSMLAESRWSASIGEHWYRTETYTTTRNGKRVTRTRRVQETEWWPLEGNHHQYHNGYLVSGSDSLPVSQANRIKPFRLEGLHRYQPYFLAGWLCEEYSVERDEALQVSQQEFRSRENHAIAAFLPGDNHRQLQVATEFDHINSDLILLPVYVLSYRYGETVYRFMINGQTGKCAGDKPTSSKRIAAAVAAGLFVIAVTALLFFLMAQ